MIFQSHSRQCFQEIDSPEFEPMFSNPNSHIFTASNLVCVGGWGGGEGDMRKERKRENLSIILVFLGMPISSLRT